MKREDIVIRHAILSDLDAVKRLVDTNRESLGFVIRSSLACGIEKQWILIAEYQGQVAGFAHYRHRQDRQTTLYQLCVRSEYRGQGVGKALLRSLQTESQSIGKTSIVLKTPIDLPANAFYQGLGFISRGIRPGKRRPLQIWELRWT